MDDGSESSTKLVELFKGMDPTTTSAILSALDESYAANAGPGHRKDSQAQLGAIGETPSGTRGFSNFTGRPRSPDETSITTTSSWNYGLCPPQGNPDAGTSSASCQDSGAMDCTTSAATERGAGSIALRATARPFGPREEETASAQPDHFTSCPTTEGTSKIWAKAKEATTTSDAATVSWRNGATGCTTGLARGIPVGRDRIRGADDRRSAPYAIPADATRQLSSGSYQYPGQPQPRATSTPKKRDSLKQISASPRSRRTVAIPDSETSEEGEREALIKMLVPRPKLKEKSTADDNPWLSHIVLNFEMGFQAIHDVFSTQLVTFGQPVRLAQVLHVLWNKQPGDFLHRFAYAGLKMRLLAEPRRANYYLSANCFPTEESSYCVSYVEERSQKKGYPPIGFIPTDRAKFQRKRVHVLS